MIVGIVKETAAGETRVAMTPGAISALAKLKMEVLIEAGAGVTAGFDDADYAAKGGKVGGRGEVLAAADVLLMVRCTPESVERDFPELKANCLVIGFCDPLGSPKMIGRATRSAISLISMELIPRITRAQTMDALSSQANIAGYKAAVMAAEALPKIMPMLMTAAGTLQAARVFVIGAGVAGLQAISTARRLGAVVSGFDVRAAVREQVQSVGAKFIELPQEIGDLQDKGGYAKTLTPEQQRKQMELLARVVIESDAVITTAAVPGRAAPRLISAETVTKMQRGSVIVDMAAERGGNCELTVPGETVVKHGVTIIGHTNIPATVPLHSSNMYANNLAKLLAILVNKEGALNIDTVDEVIAGCLVVHRGAVVHPRVNELLGAQTPTKAAEPVLAPATAAQ